MNSLMGTRWIFLLAAALVSWTGIGLAGDEPISPPKNSVVPFISVSGDHAYPPYEYLDGGTATGFNIELIQAVAEVMGIRMEVALGPWRDVRRQLEEGQIHVLAGMYYSEERAKDVEFSVPHTMVSSGLFVRRNSGIRTLDDLPGTEVLVQAGDIMHDYLVSSPMAVRVIPIQDPVEALHLLSEGKHDAALLSSKVQGMFFINRLGLDNLRVLETGLPAREYCFAVAKGNEQLTHRLNEGLSIIKGDNRYRRIHDNWFGVYEETGIWHNARPYLPPILLILAVPALAGYVWSWTLKRTVARRTRELEDSRRHLNRFSRFNQLLLDTSPVFITAIDFNGKTLMMNQAMLDALEYTRDEVEGVDYLAVFVPEEDREHLRRLFEDLMRDHVPTVNENRIVSKSGRIYVVEWHGRSVSATEEDAGFFVGMGIDITDRKQIEEEREKLQVRLHQAQKMESVGTLAGGVAHDFNNLLQSMSGNVQLLLRDNTNESMAVRLHGIARSIDRAARLIRQLLLFSRKAVVERQRLDLNRAVEDGAGMLERAIPKMISIELNLSDDIRPVEADPVQVEQVILNLGSNAADAMPDGGRLILETSNVLLEEPADSHLSLKPGPYALLAVTDTGCGMDKATLAQIFDPFFTTKEVGKGTGLGLASVYGIVSSHGGHVLCYSEPGRGTTFKIYWPAARSMAEAGEPFHGDEKTTEIRQPPPASSNGPTTILVVDDDKQILALTREVLEDLGYTVVTAVCGEDALAVYTEKAGKIDMVILDLGMPGMGGRQCLRELLDIDPGAKVLIASGYAESRLIEEIRQSGAAGFLGKPYRLNDLAARIREVLDR